MHFLDKLRPFALLVLRCALGIIFLYHGCPKLFGQTANAQRFFTGAGFPAYAVYIAGVLECFGGGLLIVGLFTRPVAFLLSAEMVVAIWKVHLGKGLTAVREYELPLALAVAAFTLATVGAGAVSLDQPIFGKRARARSKSRPS